MDKIFSLALNTYRELVRGKVLYTTFFFALTVVLVSALFGSVTIGDQVKVIKDFGLFSITFCAAAFCVISGASLLSKELSRKTVFNILAKPVSRFEFIIGKYLGMLATSALMILIMSIMLAAFSGVFEGGFDQSIIKGSIFILCQIIILCAAAIFFSSLVVTPVLAGLFTFALFLAGRSVEYLLYFVNEGETGPVLSNVLKGLYFILPNLSSMNVASDIVFNQSAQIGGDRILWTLLYSFGYSTALLVLGSMAFKRKEFN